MDFGVMIPHTGRRASPEFVRRFCETADDAGFDGLWGVDHMVMPHHTDSEYTLGRQPAAIADDAVSNLLSPNYELMTTLTWVAGFHAPRQARHRGRGAPHPQHGRERAPAGHPRRVLGRSRAVRDRRRMAA